MGLTLLMMSIFGEKLSKYKYKKEEKERQERLLLKNRVYQLI
jgi:hypothetical protein